MCSPLSRSDQISLLIRSNPVETAIVVTCVALAALAALQFFGVIGGPAILRLISFFAVVPSLALSGYCIHRIHQQSDLVQYGLVRSDKTKKSGNCLLDNVLALIGADETSSQLRERLVAFMRERSDFNLDETIHSISKGSGVEKIACNSKESYLDAIAQDNVWCSEVEVGMLAKMLRRTIYAIHHSGHVQEFPPDALAPAEAPIFLFNEERHFVGCKPLRSITAESIAGYLRAAAGAA